MKNSRRKCVTISIILLVIAVIYTVLVKYVDVKAIGPQGSEVGFSILNKFVHGLLPFNETFYKISKYAGLLPFGFVAAYGLHGFINLIKNKGFKKMDKKYIILGLFYIIFVAMYLFFEKIPINYRPVLVKGALEASYPSTHTLLAICLCGSSLIVSKFLIKNELLRKLADCAAWCLMVVIVIARMISGVHWLSDILGGIIISLTFLSFLKLSLIRMDEKELTTDLKK
jgi:undecaprenyl-diphosphatase